MKLLTKIRGESKKFERSFNENDQILVALNEIYPIKHIAHKKEHKAALVAFEYVTENIYSLGRGKEKKTVAEYLEILSECIQKFEAIEYSDVTDNHSFGDIVKDLLELKGWKPVKLEPIFGTKSTVSKYLNDKSVPKKGHIEDLCKLFGVSSNVFIR